MAATKGKLTKLQQDQVRSAIQTTQLVKRLQFYALGQDDPSNRTPVELDTGRLRAIETLLRKTLPDLSTVSITNEGGEPFKTKETGNGAAKLAAALDAIASRASGEPAGD